MSSWEKEIFSPDSTIKDERYKKKNKKNKKKNKKKIKKKNNFPNSFETVDQQ